MLRKGKMFSKKQNICDSRYSLGYMFFTLIELLAVIAIIAILASMLLPALKKVRESGRQIVCTGNLKQIGYATTQYMSDYSGYYPIWYDGTSGYKSYWHGKLFDSGYISKNIFNCPSFKTSSDNNWTLYPSRIHYGYNDRHIGGSYRYGNTTVPRLPPAKDAQLKSPSKTIILLESAETDSFLFGWYLAVDEYQTWNVPHARHNKNINVNWGDNHVSPIKISNIANPWQNLTSSQNGGHPNSSDSDWWDRY